MKNQNGDVKRGACCLAGKECRFTTVGLTVNRAEIQSEAQYR